MDKILFIYCFIAISTLFAEQSLKDDSQEKDNIKKQKELFCEQEELKLVELKGFIDKNLTFEHFTTKEQLDDKWQNIDGTLDNFYKMLENIIPYWDECQFKRFSNEEARLGMISISPNIGHPNATISGWCLGGYYIPLKDVKRTKKNLKNYLYQKIKDRYAKVPTIAELKKREDEQRELERQAELAKKEELEEAVRIAKEQQRQEELDMARQKQQKEMQKQKQNKCFDSCKPKKGAAYDICINDCKRIYGGTK